MNKEVSPFTRLARSIPVVVVVRSFRPHLARSRDSIAPPASTPRLVSAPPTLLRLLPFRVPPAINLVGGLAIDKLKRSFGQVDAIRRPGDGAREGSRFRAIGQRQER